MKLINACTSRPVLLSIDIGMIIKDNTFILYLYVKENGKTKK